MKIHIINLLIIQNYVKKNPVKMSILEIGQYRLSVITSRYITYIVNIMLSIFM